MKQRTIKFEEDNIRYGLKELLLSHPDYRDENNNATNRLLVDKIKRMNLNVSEIVITTKHQKVYF